MLSLTLTCLSCSAGAVASAMAISDSGRAKFYHSRQCSRRSDTPL